MFTLLGRVPISHIMSSKALKDTLTDNTFSVAPIGDAGE